MLRPLSETEPVHSHLRIYSSVFTELVKSPIISESSQVWLGAAGYGYRARWMTEQVLVSYIFTP